MNDQEKNTTSNNQSSLVEVKIDDLILGRKLRFPIHDQAELLLLSEGTQITSEFKKQLRDRNISSVQLHAEDAGHLILRHDAPHVASAPETPARFDNIVSEKLETAVNSGLPFVTNEGPAVGKSVVQHDSKKYDPEQRKVFAKEHQKNNHEMMGMMQDVLKGDSINGGRIQEMTESYLQHLCADINNFTSSISSLQEDRSIAQHAMKMSVLAMGIAVEIGLNSDNVSKIGVTALLHDWGMLRVPENLRDPDHELSHLEMFEVQKHPMYSVDLLEQATNLPALVPLLSYQVHERIDGTGYPRKRTEQGIHLFARILNVAHEYTELTAQKKYRPAYSAYTAMSMLLNPATGRCHDPLIMRVLLRLQSLFPVGSYVVLSDGSAAKVMRANGDHFTKPIVQLLQTPDGTPIEETEELVDLCNENRTITQALRTPGTNELIHIPIAKTEPPKTPRTSVKLITGPHWNSNTSRMRKQKRPSRRRVIRSNR